MDKKILAELLEDIRQVNIAIIGDFCLDVYWHADMTRSELSRETPHFPLPVVRERFSCGAAGNVAANAKALCPSSVLAVGVVGEDWRGYVLKEEFAKLGIDFDLMTSCPDRFTGAYCKPLKSGISSTVYEAPRLDFSSYSPLSMQQQAELMQRVRTAVSRADVIAVSDQLEYGVVTPLIRELLIKEASSGKLIIADSRSNISSFCNMWIKPNELEAYRAVYGETESEACDYCEIAKKLGQKTNGRVIQTLGDKGSIIFSNNEITKIKPVPVEGEIDICGAGDSFLAAFSLAMATGVGEIVSAEFASMAAAVTIRKIGTTGTASAAELISLNDSLA